MRGGEVANFRRNKILSNVTFVILFLVCLGAYTPERLGDFSWSGVSLGILFLYHFLPLQWLAVVSTCSLSIF